MFSFLFDKLFLARGFSKKDQVVSVITEESKHSVFITLATRVTIFTFVRNKCEDLKEFSRFVLGKCRTKTEQMSSASDCNYRGGAGAGES